MRKVLENIALVLTIVTSLLAIIIFLSGRASLQEFISTSSVPTPTTTTSSSSGTGSDPLKIVANGGFGSLAAVLWAALWWISAVVLWWKWPREKAQYRGCGMAILMYVIVMIGLPLMTLFLSYIAYGLLEMRMTVSIMLVLFANVIAYPSSFLVAYGLKRWMMSLI